MKKLMRRFSFLSICKARLELGKCLSQYRKRSLNLMIPLMLIGTTLIVGVIAIASYQTVRELIVEKLKQNALQEVSQGTNNIDQWLAIQKAEVQTLANTPTVRSLNRLIVEPYLQSEVKRLNDFFFFLVANADGSYYNTQVGRAQANLKDREYFKKAIAGQLNISDPLISRTTKKTVIFIVAPIQKNTSANSAAIGVFGGSFKVDRLIKVVNQLKYGNNSYAFALNSQGEVIAHPNSKLIGTFEQPAPSLLNSTDPNLAAIARRMVNREQGIELRQFDGTLKYIAYVPLQETNWSIALVIPQQNIESKLSSLNWLAFTLGILPIISAFVVWRQIRLSQKAKIQVKLLRQTQGELQQQTQDLEQALEELKRTHSHLIQSEKMSSLGQLVAGVAHEINNPVNFISNNINYADEYTKDLLKILELYQQYYPNPTPELTEQISTIDLDFLVKDLPKLINSMKVGADRIQNIVVSLRNFSRKDESEMKAVDIHEGINSTLMLLQYRLKAKPEYLGIEVIKKYGDLPLIECCASQLNQVFMNILTNAIDALEECDKQRTELELVQTPTIKIITSLVEKKWIKIQISDNGSGIPESLQKQIFDPFFTTKPVGKGTGLGLSISYKIVTEKHQGRLRCNSCFKHGTEFIIEIPSHNSN
ncbi:MAG: cache domain-containing protein [Coleofasciculaceae cyanobacterium]